MDLGFPHLPKHSQRPNGRRKEKEKTQGLQKYPTVHLLSQLAVDDEITLKMKELFSR